MDEPSLLDYLEEKLGLRKPREVKADGAVPEESKTSFEETRPRLPWSSLLAILLALAGQRMLEPTTRSLTFGLIFYAAAAGFLVRAMLLREWQIAPLKEAEFQPLDVSSRRCAALSDAAYAHQFLCLQRQQIHHSQPDPLAGIDPGCFCRVLDPTADGRMGTFQGECQRFFKNPGVHLRLSGWDLLLLAVMLVAVYFRMYQLNAVPNEMISDHAEKLLDVNDVLNGQTSIFLPAIPGVRHFNST